MQRPEKEEGTLSEPSPSPSGTTHSRRTARVGPLCAAAIVKVGTAFHCHPNLQLGSQQSKGVARTEFVTSKRITRHLHVHVTASYTRSRYSSSSSTSPSRSLPTLLPLPSSPQKLPLALALLLALLLSLSLFPPPIRLESPPASLLPPSS